jgi:hypothetical protein
MRVVDDRLAAATERRLEHVVSPAAREGLVAKDGPLVDDDRRLGRAARQKPRLSVHLPPREIDAAGEHHLSGLVTSSVSSAGSETMFSMPLAYSSTLDQRQPVAHIRDGRRPTWRSLGARTSRAALEERRQKHTLNASVYCKHAAPRVFLSQAGPRFDLDLFKLSITFVLSLTETLRRRKRRPGWVALVWLAMRLTI